MLEMRYIQEKLSYEDLGFQRWPEFYLCGGLSRLHQIFNTTTFDERCQLLKPRRDYPQHSLSRGLDNVRDEQEQKASGSNQTDLSVDSFPTESTMGSDRGPAEAWRWANIVHSLVRNPSTEGALRKRGYVMWDYARLAAWGLLDYDWYDIFVEGPSGAYQRSRHIGDMWKSHDKRREIWDRGGRGWWNPGDESRVVWLPSTQTT